MATEDAMPCSRKYSRVSSAASRARKTQSSSTTIATPINPTPMMRRQVIRQIIP